MYDDLVENNLNKSLDEYKLKKLLGDPDSEQPYQGFIRMYYYLGSKYDVDQRVMIISLDKKGKLDRYSLLVP